MMTMELFGFRRPPLLQCAPGTSWWSYLQAPLPGLRALPHWPY